MTLAQNHQQRLNGNNIRPVVTLSKQAYKGALSVPLLEFEYFTPELDLNKYDGLIITSKEAVKALSYLKWEHMRVYCVGEATASLVHNVVYSQNIGGASELANYLENNSTNEKLLYCRGENVSVDLASRLGVDEIILYKSNCVKDKKDKTIPSNSIIIFSSPSTVECFLEIYKFENDFKAIALGKTTALSLIDAKIPHEISPSTTILNAIDYAKRLG